jgi:hypothetical protein
MKALTEGRYRGRDGNAVLFDVGHRAAALATIRVSILERDIGRVTRSAEVMSRLRRALRMSCTVSLPASTTCQASPTHPSP